MRAFFKQKRNLRFGGAHKALLLGCVVSASYLASKYVKAQDLETEQEMQEETMIIQQFQGMMEWFGIHYLTVR
jgi:hypothetical protein